MSKEKVKATASLNDAVAQIVSNYFAQANAKDTVYSTSDGNVFENLGFATNHASTLEDKNVTPHIDTNRLEVIEDLDFDESAIILNAEQKELLNTGLIKENYTKLKQLASFLELHTEDQKADTIIHALEEYKAKIQK
ncbi:hypothetical protein GJU43_14015 [Flavobacterium sp. LC2016-23]|uniref:hypothetical protein n=1 Tax=Flavobacterium sp. LC2016-23 TaxID=2666330 RepID=UPI0012B08969|nr:hypothetical protein [Flavobacterium sp. LC2016-23]MRX40399.1 hypothetical protein [Flavobacterium sp. LC2016-23]